MWILEEQKNLWFEIWEVCDETKTGRFTSVPAYSCPNSVSFNHHVLGRFQTSLHLIQFIIHRLSRFWVASDLIIKYCMFKHYFLSFVSVMLYVETKSIFEYLLSTFHCLFEWSFPLSRSRQTVILFTRVYLGARIDYTFQNCLHVS